MSRTTNYKIKCLKDDRIFDTLQEVCQFYNMTKDQISYRLDVVKNYKDGMNFVRVSNNDEAIKTTENVDSAKYVEKFGDKTVPVPGYEGHYTISTKGVVTNIKSKPPRVLSVKTTIKVKNTVILHGENKTQTHYVEGLLKKAFGEVEEKNEDAKKD